LVPYGAHLNIPSIQLNDGPQGFRSQGHPGTTTAWPSGMTIGTTFDLNQALKWGTTMGEHPRHHTMHACCPTQVGCNRIGRPRAASSNVARAGVCHVARAGVCHVARAGVCQCCTCLSHTVYRVAVLRLAGEEFLGKGANVQLGPGVCLARVPNCGRLFEYISGGFSCHGLVLHSARVWGLVVLPLQPRRGLSDCPHQVVDGPPPCSCVPQARIRTSATPWCSQSSPVSRAWV
jgi:hypothetical protein